MDGRTNKLSESAALPKPLFCVFCLFPFIPFPVSLLSVSLSLSPPSLSLSRLHLLLHPAHYSHKQTPSDNSCVSIPFPFVFSLSPSDLLSPHLDTFPSSPAFLDLWILCSWRVHQGTATPPSKPHPVSQRRVCVCECVSVCVCAQTKCDQGQSSLGLEDALWWGCRRPWKT